MGGKGSRLRRLLVHQLGGEVLQQRCSCWQNNFFDAKEYQIWSHHTITLSHPTETWHSPISHLHLHPPTSLSHHPTHSPSLPPSHPSKHHPIQHPTHHPTQHSTHHPKHCSSHQCTCHCLHIKHHPTLHYRAARCLGSSGSSVEGAMPGGQPPLLRRLPNLGKL